MISTRWACGISAKGTKTKVLRGVQGQRSCIGLIQLKFFSMSYWLVRRVCNFLSHGLERCTNYGLSVALPAEIINVLQIVRRASNAMFISFIVGIVLCFVSSLLNFVVI